MKTVTDARIVAFAPALVAVSQVSTSIYLPASPALVTVFDTSTTMVQLTFTVYLIGAAFSQLISGPLSDRFGRRPVLLGGLVLYVLASIAAAAATSIEALIVARVFQATGAMTGPVIGRAMIRDRFDRSRSAKALANVSLALAVSPALAPLLGAFVFEAAGWRANFVLVAAFGLLMLVLALGLLGETNRQRQIGAGPADLAGNYLKLLRSRAFLSYALPAALLFGTMFTFLSEGPHVLITMMGMSPTAFATYAALVACGFAVGSFASSRLTVRLGIDRMIALGLIAAATGAAALVVVASTGATSIVGLVAPMTVIVFGLGLVFPNGMAGAISVHPEFAGTSSAMVGFLQMVFSALGTVVPELFADGTELPMVLTVAGGVVLAGASFALKPGGLHAGPGQAPVGVRTAE